MHVESPGDDLDEGEDAFLDSAALMQHLDLVISTDTSTFWYPSVRLFRQPRRDDWRSVFENLASEIASKLPTG